MPRSNSSTGSSETGSDREDFSDWASSLHGARRTKSLFDDSLLDTPEEALEYDERVHGYNVKSEGDRLGLDDYARIRLINYIRREVRVSIWVVRLLTGQGI
jgi:protein arginine N-methyltransferase 3